MYKWLPSCIIDGYGGVVHYDDFFGSMGSHGGVSSKLFFGVCMVHGLDSVSFLLLRSLEMTTCVL